LAGRSALKKGMKNCQVRTWEEAMGTMPVRHRAGMEDGLPGSVWLFNPPRVWKHGPQRAIFALL
jgi:hypothetical protein